MMESNKYEIVKFVDNDFELDVNVSPKEETIWLTLEQISNLFNRDRTVISKHIKIIYQEHELNENSTCAKNSHMGQDEKRCLNCQDNLLDLKERISQIENKIDNE